MLHQGPGKHWNQSQQTLGERQEFTTYSNQLLIPDCLPRKLAAALVHCHHETILLALRLCLPVSATIKVSCPKWRNVAATKLLRKICQLWGWLVRCFRWGKKGTQRRVFCLGSVTVARPLFARWLCWYLQSSSPAACFCSALRGSKRNTDSYLHSRGVAAAWQDIGADLILQSLVYWEPLNQACLQTLNRII